MILVFCFRWPIFWRLLQVRPGPPEKAFGIAGARLIGGICDAMSFLSANRSTVSTALKAYLVIISVHLTLCQKMHHFSF